MPVCGNYLFFELPKKIVLNPKDGCTFGGCGDGLPLRLLDRARQSRYTGAVGGVGEAKKGASGGFSRVIAGIAKDAVHKKVE